MLSHVCVLKAFHIVVHICVKKAKERYCRLLWEIYRLNITLNRNPFCSGLGYYCIIPRLHLCLLLQCSECLQLLPEEVQPLFKSARFPLASAVHDFHPKKISKCFLSCMMLSWEMRQLLGGQSRMLFLPSGGLCSFSTASAVLYLFARYLCLNHMGK